MAKPKIGDIFELETSRGIAFLQFVEDDPKFGTFANFTWPGDPTQNLVGDIAFTESFPVIKSFKSGEIKLTETKIEIVPFMPPLRRSRQLDQEKAPNWGIYQGGLTTNVDEKYPGLRDMSDLYVGNLAAVRERLESRKTNAELFDLAYEYVGTSTQD